MQTKDITLSYSDLGTYYLYLYHDDKGKIVDLVKPVPSRFAIVIKELMESGNLSDYFDFPDSMPDTIELKINRPFKRSIFPVAFWTNIPTVNIHSSRKGEVYFCRLTIVGILPNVHASAHSHYIYLDRNSETLQGFSKAFHDLFSDQYPEPEKMLGQPIFKFIKPSPFDIQKGMKTSVSMDRFDTSTFVYNKDFLNDKISADEEIPIPSELSYTANGLRWTYKASDPHSPESAFITLPVKLNTHSTDFRIAIRYTEATTSGPVLILGSTYVREDELPDNEGYLAGLDKYGKTLILKKYGYIVDTCSKSSSASTNEHTLSLCKIGKQLLLISDGVIRLSFNDLTFINQKDGRFTIGLRRGESCIIRSISVETIPAETATGEPYDITTSQTEEARSFEVEQFFNQALQEPDHRHIAAFFLHDITAISNKIQLLDKAVKFHASEGKRLKNLLTRYTNKTNYIIGSGRIMEQLKESAARVAQTGATVLIEGPTGSGKEVLAKYIHELSDRSSHPFVKVDCATIPATLIESQLFGHEKGAFTGAIRRSIGSFEQADKGTIFIDEAENLHLDIQVKLLRFLNDFSISRVGGTGDIRLDVRCIVASNTSLSNLVSRGPFREDLYYRINAVILTIPPLSKRREDIPELASHFLKAAAIEYKKSITGFSAEGLKKLIAHSYNGNIRELKNVVQRAVIFSTGSLISAADIEFAETVTEQPFERKQAPDYHFSRTEPEKIIEILRRHNGRITKAVKEMNITRPALYNYLNKHGIDINTFRKGL